MRSRQPETSAHRAHGTRVSSRERQKLSYRQMNEVSNELTATLLEGIAGVVRLTAADEAADCVGALGVLAAGISLAFVHVC